MLIGIKVMTKNTKKQKTQKMQTSVFVQNHEKKRNGNICVLCHNFWTNQIKTCQAPQNDLYNLRFGKDEHTYGKEMARKVVQRLFIKGHSFRNSL